MLRTIAVRTATGGAIGAALWLAVIEGYAFSKGRLAPEVLADDLVVAPIFVVGAALVLNAGAPLDRRFVRPRRRARLQRLIGK